MTNEEMREETGNVNGTKLDGFIYILLRDHITCSAMEKIVIDCEKAGNKTLQFTNGHLANYAKLINKRINN